MTEQLEDLIEKARTEKMTPEQKEAQRISFAFGNIKIGDQSATKQSVIHASKLLREGHADDGETPIQDAG